MHHGCNQAQTETGRTAQTSEEDRSGPPSLPSLNTPELHRLSSDSAGRYYFIAPSCGASGNGPLSCTSPNMDVKIRGSSEVSCTLSLDAL